MAEGLINLKDPETGEIGSLPASQVSGALQQGFTQASPEEVDNFFKEEKYGGLGQQVATGAEGLASGLSFGLSTGAERAIGVPAEDIRARREVNPISHGVGEIAGIGVGSLYGVGEAATLEKAGAAVAGKIAGEGLVSKIGSQAAKLATENVLFQGGDELSKMFSSDPHQSIGTAMADVGLAGLIGGATGTALGSISPLWKATAGKQIESVLNAIKSKAGGIENMTSQPIKDALDQSGIQIAPEVKAAFSDDPHLLNVAKTLESSDTTKSGLEFQQSMKNAKQELNDSALGAFGHNLESVKTLEKPSKSAFGKSVGDSIADDIQARVEPLVKEFEELKGKVGNVELPSDTIIETPRTVADPNDLTGLPQTVLEKTRTPGVMSQAGDKLGELASQNKWVIGDGTSGAELYEFASKNMSKVKDLDGLNGLVKRISDKAKRLSSFENKTPLHEASQIKRILRDIESDVIEKHLGEHGQEYLDRFRNVRSNWGNAADLIDQVKDQIGVKSSVSGYAKAIREMAQQDGEALLRRIAGSGNASGLKLLQEQFPNAAELFKQYHIQDMLERSATKAAAGQEFSVKKLIGKVNDLSPEMKSFLVPEESAQKLKAVDALLDHLAKTPDNASNTARVWDKLNQYVPGGAVAMAGALTGHGVMGLLAGPLVKFLSKDVPDAVRLSMLKFLGSAQAVDSAGFKAMTDVARAIYRGEQVMNKAASGVFKSGSKVIGSQDVSQRERDKLDKTLLALKEDPSPLMGVGGDIGHYLPDHATAAASVSMQAANYLNSLRPNTDKQMPLDAKMPADPVKEAAFQRALTIAQNPVTVMADVKDGSITPEDLMTLQNVAPGFYASMRNKINNEIINHTADDGVIPYKTRLGLALFLGQPLDSTMTPMAIQSAQPMLAAPPQQMAGMKPTATGMQKLSKLPASVATAGQQREMGRGKNIS